MAAVHRALPLKTSDELTRLRVKDLKEILRSAGCSLGGRKRKAEIIEYYQEQARHALPEAGYSPPVPPRENHNNAAALPAARASKMKTTECPVCLEDVLPADDCDFECLHAIHVACARKLRDTRCPMCRADISAATSRIAAADVAEMQRRKGEDSPARSSFFEPGVRTGLIVRRIDETRVRATQPSYAAATQARAVPQAVDDLAGQIETGGTRRLPANDPRTALLQAWEAFGAGVRNAIQIPGSAVSGLDPAENTAEYAAAVNEAVEMLLGMPAAGIQQVAAALQASHPFYSPGFLDRLQAQVRQILV